MIFIGIDPGKTGALGVIWGYPNGKFGLWVYDFDPDKFVTDLRAFTVQKPFCVLEKVGAMPGQGVTSMFNFGKNAGMWIGVLKSFGIPYEEIAPQKWQKEIFDSARGGDPKDRSRAMALKLFPDLGPQLQRKKDHNRADAILMAEYARRIYKQRYGKGE
jgi:hypothetical protein